MSERLAIIESPQLDGLLLHVRGELDIASVPQLSNRLLALLREGRDVALDLSEVGFIDSSGVSVLIAGARAAELSGSTLTIRAVSAAALRVLELTGVTERLQLSPDAASSSAEPTAERQRR